MSIRNAADSSQTDPLVEVNELAPILNYLCDELWRRDKIIAGNLSGSNADAGRIGYC